MKKIISITILLLFAPLMCVGQTYQQLWDDIAAFKQKDLPRSVISTTENIMAKAKAEHNIPQLLTAYLTRSEYRVMLDGGNRLLEKKALEQWADTASNAVVKAVLNSIVADKMVRAQVQNVDEILRRIDSSLQHKKVLSELKASDFVPLTVCTDFSNKYLSDNLYELLAREAIRTLNSNWYVRNAKEVQLRILSLYDELIEFHAGNRQAQLLTREAKTLYLSSYWVIDKYRLDTDEVISRLQQLADEYSDLEACADVYVKLALRYNANGNPAKAMQILQTAKAKYRRTDFSDMINQNIQYLLNPYLVVSIESLFPRAGVDMNVVYRNLTSFNISVYRLSLTPADVLSMADYQLGEQTIRKYGKKVSNRKFALPATDDLKDKSVQLSYPLPEPGVYMFKFTANGNEAPTYRLACVSGNNCLTLITDKDMMELIALDKTTGHPLPEAEFVIFERQGETYAEVERLKANRQGSVMVNRADYAKKYFNVETLTDSFMPVQRMYSTYLFKDREVRRECVVDHLFTDRSIYRPGQKLYVSGVRFVQMGDSTHVQSEEKVTLQLIDSHFKTIATKQLTTDDFGTFSAEFILPETVLPGMFHIKTDKSQSNFRVEEYKRPTFNVEFSPYSEAYHFGDSINVEGMAQMFSGAPVQGARVEYKVRRWQAWFWRMDYRDRTVLKKGEITVDADGKFRLGFTLQQPDRLENAYSRYYVYDVEAKVTARNGETHISTMRLPVGRQSIGLMVEGLNGTVVREQPHEVQLQAMNLNQQKVDIPVAYYIYKVGAEGKKGAQVLEGKMQSNTAFVPKDIYALPSGKYRIELKTFDDHQHECKAESDFTLFSVNDRKVPYPTTAWLYHDSEVFAEGQPVTCYAGTSEKDVYLLVDIYNNQGRLKSERIYLNDEIRKFTFHYQKEYGDGLEVNFSIIRNGRLYVEDAYIRLAEPDKHLNLSWKTFRNHLRPGNQEEWIMKITDKDGRPAKANLMAMMYDAALDDIYVRHQHHRLSFVRRWIGGYAHFGIGDHWMNAEMKFPFTSESTGFDFMSSDLYSRLLKLNLYGRPYARNGVVELKSKVYSVGAQNAPLTDAVFEEEIVVESTEESRLIPVPAEQNGTTLSVLRDNFNETAFFYPVLRTDSAGEASISFTLPDALTEWNFMAYAHTQNMDYGMLTEKVKASKPFMVQPNMPRYVRVGDKSVFAASLINLSDSVLCGGVKITLVDPLTDKVVYADSRPFTVGAKQTGVVDFTYRTDALHDLLVFRIEAQSNGFSDGEQHYLPVLSDRELITETIPVQLDGPETVSLSLNHLFNDGSSTATHRHLTVELTANPDWYAVQALPYMSAPSSENAISWAVAYYANAMAMHIVDANPGIRKAVQMWNLKDDKNGLLSQLEHNRELKQILLEESPWLADALTETEQKHRMALLFDLNSMAAHQQAVIRRLSALQLADGSWPWYQGMSGSLYITTQIVEYMARLRSMGIVLNQDAQRMCTNAFSYLERQARKEYEYKRDHKPSGQPFTLSEMTLRYLYICSVDKFLFDTSDQKMNQWLIHSMLGRSAEYTIYGKALMAIIMHENGHPDEAAILLRSLREYAVYGKDMGRHYNSHNAYYSFRDTRIPTQVAVMEAIGRIDRNDEELNQMKQWLLKQKQVQMWRTPTASADAIHAMLCMGEKRLAVRSRMKATIGRQTIITPADLIGYAKQSVQDVNVKRITISKTGRGISWGAVYAQCKDKVSAIKAYQSKGLAIERTLLKDGQPMADATALHAGDKLTVRLTVSVDRDMDFVQIEDRRAACLEPLEQLSGYRWKGGLGYYAVTHDASTQFFIDRVRQGTYSIEYTVLVDRSGVYHMGTASIQCAYAPEFAAHTDGGFLKVE